MVLDTLNLFYALCKSSPQFLSGCIVCNVSVGGKYNKNKNVPNMKCIRKALELCKRFQFDRTCQAMLHNAAVVLVNG